MFNFNIYSSLLLIGCFQAVVFAVLLIVRWRKGGRLSDLFAALILLIGGAYAAQWMFGFAGWYDARDWRPTVMFYVEWNHLTALGPLIWLYFLALTNTEFRWEKRYWLHLMPALLFCLLLIGMLFYDFLIHAGIQGLPFEGFEGTRGPAMEYKHEQLEWIAAIEHIFMVVQLPVYLVLTLSLYRKYRTYVSNQFASGEEHHLAGLRNLLYIFLVGIGIAYTSQVLAKAITEMNYSDVWPRYFAVAMLVYAAGIQFYRIDNRQTRQLRFDPEPAPVEELPPDADRWIVKLETQLEQYKNYLEPDLKLADLAKLIGANSSILSKVINVHYGINFNDLINRYRCAEFIAKLERNEHKQHTLLSLALDSGFNSKSTFNRAFRKQYGYSPGEAVQRLVSNDDLGRPKN